MEPPCLAAARAYLAAGLSILPIKGDGSKAPDGGAWKHLQERRATDEEVARWFSGPHVGVGIIGGTISGNLEILDVDDGGAWVEWRERVLAILHDRRVACPPLPTVETPKGGRHLYYRLHSGPPTNTKLAVRPKEDGGRVTVIETRGEAGYVVAPPSPARCHPLGKPYVLLQGDLARIPVVEDAVRDVFWEVALAMTEVPVVRSAPMEPSPRLRDGTRPGDLYCQRASWEGLLSRHGWRMVYRRGAAAYWRRPGKDRGSISATTNHDGTNYLYCFSSNASPFEPMRGYSLFGALGLLDYAGDYDRAARDLADRGYAAPATVVTPRPAQSSARTVDDLFRRRLRSAYR